MSIDDFFDELGIPKKLIKGDFKINDLKIHFTSIRRKKLIERYGNQAVNPNFYGKIEITQNNKPIKYLTEEEFKAGKRGYMLGNFLIKDI